MLKLFRQKKLAVKILLVAIVVVVGGAMLVFLVPGVGSGVPMSSPQGVVAQVEGQPPLTQNQVQRRYQQAVRQMGVQGEQFRSLIMERLVHELIVQRAVAYEAERLGLQLPPREFAEHLRQLSFLYPAGEFVGMDVYRQTVQREYGMSIPRFEAMLRQQLLQAKMFRWVTDGITVSPAEVAREYRRREEKVRIEFAVLDPERFARRVEPGEDELRGYFEQNRQQYRIPEKRAVRYVAIDFDRLDRRVEVTAEELRQYYTENLQSYHQPEQARVRHILLLLPAGVGPGSEEAAAVRERAEQLLERLRAGADFAALAREHSEDNATKEEGGLIGWVRRGQTVPALEEAIFSPSEGAPAPRLVETEYGFHLIEVLDRQKESVRPFAQVKEEIRPRVKQQKVRRLAREQALQVVSEARAGAALEQAAQAQGWPVRETGLFARQEVVASFPPDSGFQEAAFRLPARNAGQPDAPVSDPVQLPPGYAVVQLKQLRPARPAELAEVRARVLEDYRREEGARQAREAARRLADRAGETDSLRGPARALGVDVTTSGFFARSDFVPDLGSARDIAPVAFNLEQGGLSPALPVNNKWVVFRLLARQEADPAAMGEGEREAIRSALLESKKNLAWEIFTQDLRKRLLAEGKLEINQAAVDRLVGS